MSAGAARCRRRTRRWPTATAAPIRRTIRFGMTHQDVEIGSGEMTDVRLEGNRKRPGREPKRLVDQGMTLSAWSGVTTVIPNLIWITSPCRNRCFWS